MKTKKELIKKKANGKHPGGRPPLYKMAQELQAKIDEYFESCWIDKVVEVTDKEGNVTTTNSRYQNRPYTVMGLALALGMCRDTLCEYAKNGEFSDIIKKAKAKVEMNVEENLLWGKNAAGPIFWLKNHAGYRDKQELEHKGPNGQPLEGPTITATPMEVAVKIAYLFRQYLAEQKKRTIEVTAGEPELKQKDNG